MLKETHKAALASYARSFTVAALAVYATGDMSLEHMLYAGVAAIVGPAIRAINPNDPAFGRSADLINEAVAIWIDKLIEAESEPKPKKKTAKKKSVKKK